MCMACAGIPFGPYHRVALGAVLARTRGMLRDVLARATPADLNDTSIGVYARLRPGGEAGTEVEVKHKAGEQRHIQVLLTPGARSHSTSACHRVMEAASTRPGTICRCATSSSRSTGSSTSTRLSKTSSTAWPRHPPVLPCPRPPSPCLASPRPAYSLTSTGARGARTRGL